MLDDRKYKAFPTCLINIFISLFFKIRLIGGTCASLIEIFFVLLNQNCELSSLYQTESGRVRVELHYFLRNMTTRGNNSPHDCLFV